MMRSSADPAPLQGLDVDVVYGDILDPADVARAVDGCGRVYHAAAGFLMWATDPEHAIIRPSVDGTRNVMKAAAKAGVEKVLYVSTGGTIGFSSTPDTPRTESDYNKDAHTPYFIGKIAAEKRGLRHRRTREAAGDGDQSGSHPGSAILEAERVDQAGRSIS